MIVCTSSWTDKLLQQILPDLPFDIQTVSISMPHLPAAFQGFKIVQISDLHVDYWNRGIVDVAIETVNSLQADLLVCTGDVIAHGAHYLGDVGALLGRMTARYGKLACLGNHDYDDGSGSFGVRRTLKAAGFEVLVNDSTELSIQHQRLQLAGADDLILGRQCLHSTHRRLDADHPTVLLCHNPENFQAVSRFQPDLVLSGHTHGGQIQLPEGIRRRFMASPYVAGLYQCGGSRLYVNRGLGSAIFVRRWGERRLALPTPRLAVRPEISVFTLVCQSFSGPWESEGVRLAG